MIVGISGKLGSGKDTLGNMISIYDGAQSIFSNTELMEFPVSDAIVQRTLMYQSKFTHKKFADKLKDFVCSIIGCSRINLEDRDFKDKELGPEWWYWIIHDKMVPYEKGAELEDHLVKLTPRKIMQLVGTEAGRQIIHPNIWVNALFADYHKNFNWIITDVRFPNEAKAVKDRGGILIRINRDTPFSITDGKEVVDNVTKTIDIRGYDDFVYRDKEGIIYRTIDWSRVGDHPSETALDYWTNWDYVIDNNGTKKDLFEKVKTLNIWTPEEKVS